MPHLNYPILNCYDNTCYRICFLLLVGEDFFALSLLVPVRECVFPLWENMCFLLFLALQTIHVLGCLLGIQDGFGLFSPFVSSIIWALIMTASFLSAVPKRLSNLLKLFNLLCLVLEILLKVLVLLNQPNDNVETSTNGFLSLSVFFIWSNQFKRASRQLRTVRRREEPPLVSSAAKGCSSFGARFLLGFNCL